jgi:uncharacterized protein (TIGR02145 family)
MFTTEKLNQGIMTDERDGREYKTIGFKSQVWMAENLNYVPTGKVSETSKILLDTEQLKQCYQKSNEEGCDGTCLTTRCEEFVEWVEPDSLSICYNNDANNCLKNGRMYYYDIVNAVCPEGWHLPSVSEFVNLFKNMMDEQRCSEGIKLDSENVSDMTIEIKGPTAFDNSFGLNIPESDYRLKYTDEFAPLGIPVGFTERVPFWATSDKGVAVSVYSDYVNFDYIQGYMSVRCIKDEDE